MQTTVVYHDDCADGFGAAMAAWTAGISSQATYVPSTYDDPMPKGPDGPLRMYILDFSYPRAKIEDYLGKHPDHRIVLLDHHKTALEDLDDFSHPRFRATLDMEESGATLAWKYFHPDKPVPSFYQYLRDRDLWLFELPKSLEVSTALKMYPKTTEAWEPLLQGYAFFTLKEEGEVALRFQNAAIENMAEHMTFISLGDARVPCVNASVFRSETGDYLSKQYPDAPFSATFRVLPDGTYAWSLRTRTGFNVRKVAETYGGGGHDAASGFTTTAVKGNALLIGKE